MTTTATTNKPTAEQLVAMIRLWEDPILKTVCDPVADGEPLPWLETFRQVCFAANGAGLAAPQIGIPKRVIFVSYGKGHGLVLINPEILERSDVFVAAHEGCLSYPGWRAYIARNDWVQCAWRSPEGRAFSRRFMGFEARVVQHEVDHLDGICRVGDAWRADRK